MIKMAEIGKEGERQVGTVAMVRGCNQSYSPVLQGVLGGGIVFLSSRRYLRRRALVGRFLLREWG